MLHRINHIPSVCWRYCLTDGKRCNIKWILQSPRIFRLCTVPRLLMTTNERLYFDLGNVKCRFILVGSFCVFVKSPRAVSLIFRARHQFFSEALILRELRVIPGSTSIRMRSSDLHVLPRPICFASSSFVWFAVIRPGARTPFIIITVNVPRSIKRRDCGGTRSSSEFQLKAETLPFSLWKFSWIVNSR